jgi:DNA-binding NtrC family response regulator
MSNHPEQNILVVDDDLLVRKVLKKYISSLGYYVDTAEDGRSALDMLRSFSYDLVLTDLEMPVLDGIELLKQMSVEFPIIPKIVLTGHGTNDEILAALKSGAYDFLYKPIDDFDILEYSLKRGVESKKLREDRERHVTELEKINEIISMLNSGKSTDEIFNMLNVSLKKIMTEWFLQCLMTQTLSLKLKMFCLITVFFIHFFEKATDFLFLTFQ